MKKAFFLLIVILASTAFSKIGIIINKDFFNVPMVKTAIHTYMSDLAATSEQLWVDSTTFDDGNTRPELQQLRDSLRQHQRTDNLTGAVLIGDLPLAFFEDWYIFNIVYDSLGNPIDTIWRGENYSCDYYFMNLNDSLDTAWHDSLSPATATDDRYPYLAGYFDRYSGDSLFEIWVSRVIGHNLYHICTGYDTTTYFPSYALANPFSEDSVIVSYLNRVHARMTAPNDISRRALMMGDFKNWFEPSWPSIQNLMIPSVTLRYPHDNPEHWVRELRKGYEWACIFEHSNPQLHAFSQDEQEKNGNFCSFTNIDFSDRDRSLLQMIDSSSMPPRALFYQDIGCGNVDFSTDDCLGEMYAMLQNGLICMGSARDYAPQAGQFLYTDSLGKGNTFGQAFQKYLNSRTFISPAGECLVMVGVGTLKLQPYVTSSNPTIIIDSVWAQATDNSPYLIHGDTLILHAKISSSFGSIDTNLVDFKWYGNHDSVSGNHVPFILDGHDAPTYSSGDSQGTYTIILHAECAGFFPASKTIELPAWRINMIGASSLWFNRHTKSADGWELRLRGATEDIGGTNDNCIFYFRPIQDGSFKVTAKIKELINTNNDAKAGIMIRNGTFSGDASVFIGVKQSDSLTFQYRLSSGGSTVTHSVGGDSIGKTWVRLEKIFEKIYGLVSLDGINFSRFDSVTISAINIPQAGFAYSCSDPSSWTDTANARWAVLGKMDIAVIDTVEALPVVYASDSIKTNDRVWITAAKMGAGKALDVNRDCQLYGYVKVKGDAVLNDRSIATGTMKLSGYLTLIDGAQHYGDLYENYNVAFADIPQKTVPIGTDSIYVGNDKTRTLGPGNYKAIVVDSRGKLILNAGTYNMRTLIFKTDAKLTINGPVEINVKSYFLFDDRVIMTVSSINNVKIYTNDPEISFGEMTFKGHVVAPNARATLKSRINYRGSIKAKVLFFDCDAKLYDY